MSSTMGAIGWRTVSACVWKVLGEVVLQKTLSLISVPMLLSQMFGSYPSDLWLRCTSQKGTTTAFGFQLSERSSAFLLFVYRKSRAVGLNVLPTLRVFLGLG